LNPPVKLNVAGAGLVGEAGIYAAADKGYFKDEGLDVELLIMQQAADIIPQLIGSQLQFGAVAADAALFNAASRDIPVRIVGYTAIIAPMARRPASWCARTCWTAVVGRSPRISRA